jgi:hypothetical protein
MMCVPAVLCYVVRMTAKVLTDAMKRVETWPEEAQEELASLALEIDAALHGGTYRPAPEELTGIDRGLQAAERGRFAAPEDVAAVVAKHRPA